MASFGASSARLKKCSPSSWGRIVWAAQFAEPSSNHVSVKHPPLCVKANWNAWNSSCATVNGRVKVPEVFSSTMKAGDSSHSASLHRVSHDGMVRPVARGMLSTR